MNTFQSHGAGLTSVFHAVRRASSLPRISEGPSRFVTRGNVLPWRADVGVEGEVAEAFRQMGATFDSIDILMNNAGVEPYKNSLNFEPSDAIT